MPMLLRSRRSLHPSRAAEAGVEARDATPRRSIRLHGKKATATYEESDESDSEPTQSPVMEKHQSVPAEPEPEAEEAAEEAAEDADLTELKPCTVVLDRFGANDKAARKEREEKEDMNRKGAKPTSRIPTFHKRPSGGGQNTEMPVLKKDTPVQPITHPPQKAESGGVEASKAKVPEARETALSLPAFTLPKPTLEASLPVSGTQQPPPPHSAQITSPKSWSFSGSEQLMTASPRPALRPEQGTQQHLPEQDQSKTLQTQAPATAVSHLPPTSQRDTAEIHDADTRSRFRLKASGDTDKSAAEEMVEHVDAIMDEEPPWVTDPINTLELKDSRSSSDAECEETVEGEDPEDDDPGQVEEHHHCDVSRMESSEEDAVKMDEKLLPASKEPTRVKSAESPKRSGCSSLVLGVFLPTTLLLLGGLGQHVWHYGLPMSVAQLTAQLELHWLEGLGLVPEPCTTDCRVTLVESIPVGLYASSPSPRHSIADSWLRLLHKANSSVHIAAFYFTLRGNDLESTDSLDSEGTKVFQHLKQLESRGVTLQIAVNAPQTSVHDTADLASTGAEVREVDLKAVTGGIIHTKLWVVDQKHFYLGSANMDWRSLSQVKEVGLSVEDCGCLAQDALRVFGVYWAIGGLNNGSLPPYWPARLSALSSSHKPLHLKFNGVPARVYLSSAPPQISARGRSDDLSSILSVIHDAQRFVYISVMDYLPLSEFTQPLRFWPPIDSALRAAGCTRGVEVRLMVSCWKHSSASMFTFLQSLQVLVRPPLKCNIHVKIFAVPSTMEQMKIPFARVNHAKFMVTDRVVYIGTSNWSENYFTQTAGVGLVVNQTGSEVGLDLQTLQSQAEQLFLRDWSSHYATALSVDDVDVCPHARH